MTVTNVEKLEFIHKISKNIKHGNRSFFDHLFNTSGIVEKLCKDIGIKNPENLLEMSASYSFLN